MISVRSALMATALVGASMTAALPALAAPVVVTYTGVVASGYDQTGEFGTAGADLTGLSFVSKYVFEPSKAQFNENYGYQQSSYGGPGYGGSSPLISATLTVGGHSVNVGDGYVSELYASNSGGFSEFFSEAYDHYIYDGQTYSYKYLNNDAYAYDGTYPGSFQAFSGPTPTNYGNYSDYAYSYTTNQYTAYTYASLTGQYLTVSLAGGVPEPATWALMILGFGLVGGALRRKVRQSNVRFNAKIKQIEAGAIA